MKHKPANKDYPYFAPERGTPSAAGHDLKYVGIPIVLQPMQRYAFTTNLILEIPEGYYGRIAPRSGLAFKQGIDVMAGVIDSDYRGEIKAILINLGDKPVSFQTGDKIAQIIFEQYLSFNFEVAEELSQTIRGEGAFGSTGR